MRPLPEPREQVIQELQRSLDRAMADEPPRSSASQGGTFTKSPEVSASGRSADQSSGASPAAQKHKKPR